MYKPCLSLALVALASALVANVLSSLLQPVPASRTPAFAPSPKRDAEVDHALAASGQIEMQFAGDPGVLHQVQFAGDPWMLHEVQFAGDPRLLHEVSGFHDDTILTSLSSQIDLTSKTLR